jgi:hypothetical protein
MENVFIKILSRLSSSLKHIFGDCDANNNKQQMNTNITKTFIIIYDPEETNVARSSPMLEYSEDKLMLIKFN